MLVPKKILINTLVNTMILIDYKIDLLYLNAEKDLQQHKIHMEHFEVEYKL